MNVFLDTDDKSLVNKVYNSIGKEFKEVSLNHGIQNEGLSPKVDRSVHIYYGEGMFDHLDVGRNRLSQMAFATKGGLLYTDKSEQSPMYAGKLPAGTEDRVLVNLRYAKTRAGFFKDYDYFGQTYVDPKNVLISTNPRASMLPKVANIMAHAKDNWWYTAGFLSSKDPEAIREFIDEYEYTYAVAMDDAVVDILSAGGVEFGDATGIDFSDPYSGVKIRTLTYRPDGGGLL